MTFYPDPTDLLFFDGTPSKVAQHFIYSKHNAIGDHSSDPMPGNSKPRGGVTTAPGMTLVWQDGPLKRDANGKPVQPATGTRS